MSDFVLSVGQAQKLEHALRRNGWSTTEVDRASEGDFLGRARQVLLGGAEIVQVTPKLLERVRQVRVGGAKRFVAADRFVVDQAGIAWMGDNFRNFFLGKTEEKVQVVTLNVWRLREAVLDEPIRAELGADCEETKLAHFFALLKKQARGQGGSLFTDGRANIFYIRDAKGVLWAVYTNRNSVGWRLYASSVTYPHRWDAGDQVFSRDS